MFLTAVNWALAYDRYYDTRCVLLRMPCTALFAAANHNSRQIKYYICTSTASTRFPLIGCCVAHARTSVPCPCLHIAGGVSHLLTLFLSPITQLSHRNVNMLHEVNATASKVELLTGYSFNDKLLAAEAVQMAAPQVAVVYGSFRGLPSNKRLSILGDAVLAKHLCTLWYSAHDARGTQSPQAPPVPI